MQTKPIVLRRTAAVAAAAIAYLVLRHAFATWSGLDRPLDTDESEFLHAAWLMRHGLRLYRDFAEDHAPFLFAILKWMVPAHGTATFPRLDLVTYVARARILASAFGIVALSAAALLAYRAVGNLIAPLITIAVVLASPWIWLRGMVQVRNDPPALCLFWLGALLLLGGWQSEKARFLCAGIGIGLVAIAALWNPKWPLESLVLGIVYLLVVRDAFRSKRVTLTLLPPIALIAAALLWIRAYASFSDYFFFTFTFNRLLNVWTAANPYLTKLTDAAFQHGRAYMFCPPAFKGVWPIAAVMVTIAFLAIPRLRLGTTCHPEAAEGAEPKAKTPEDAEGSQNSQFQPKPRNVNRVPTGAANLEILRRPPPFRRFATPSSGSLRMTDVNTLAALLALAAAATLEIRFLYAYPNVWTQYYVMWGFIAACLYGTAAAALIRLLPRDSMRLAATIVIATLSIAAVEQAMPLRPSVTGWPMLSYIQRNLRDGETVWLARHPIGVPDAGYYWYAAAELVPFAIDYAAAHPHQTPLPPMTEHDLPVCRAAQGLQPDLRFVSGGYFLEQLPQARACLDRMIAAGRAARTPAPDVWDLHP